MAEVSADKSMPGLLEVFRSAVVDVVGNPGFEIELDTEIATLGIESLDLIEVAMAIEEQLEVVLRLEDFAEVHTVRDALQVATAKAGEDV
ncbi:MAG: acyl carrier protein [Actinomycetota bacterium]|nr:acyl carrier protein [Actinomycetota bacterium]